jgi:predicted nucleotidyltransferase
MGTNNISISNVLFSKVQQQVLGLLYGQSDSDFYTNEIIRLTQSGTGAVQRELARLTAAGLLTVKQVGNQKRYKANHDTPFFIELRSIIIKTFGLTDIIRNVLKPLEKKINYTFIYGSIAKQEDTASSDVDLMIISDQLTYGQVFEVLKPAEEILNRKINPTFYTLSEWLCKQKEGNNFIRQILRQPKIFLLGKENDFNKLSEPSKSRSTKARTF